MSTRLLFTFTIIILLFILLSVDVVGADPTPVPTHDDYWQRVDNLTNASTNLTAREIGSVTTSLYESRLGDVFWVALLFPAFFLLWISKKSVILPVVLAFIISPMLFIYLPVQFQHAAYVFFALSITGIVVMWWKENKS